MPREHDDHSGLSAARAFLTSRPHLVGLLVFVVVFLGMLVMAPDPLWAGLLLGLLGYAGGYALTPQRVRTYASGVPVRGADRGQMTERLDAFEQSVRSHRDRLPPAGVAELRAVVATLRELIGTWGEISRAAEQRLVLEQMVYHYLPNTLEVFLRVPDSAKPAAAPDWTHQLQVIREEVVRSRDAVVRHDLEAMRTNGRLLEQRFEDGDLRMFREHGL